VVLVCVVLTFVPMRWAHPMRTQALRPLTLGLSGLWAVAALLTIWSGFPATPLMKAVLLGTAAYGIGLALFRGPSA
jgi:phosphatidylcholine synthase